jgi:hypothetical protein
MFRGSYNKTAYPGEYLGVGCLGKGWKGSKEPEEKQMGMVGERIGNEVEERGVFRHMQRQESWRGGKEGGRRQIAPAKKQDVGGPM